MPKQPFYKIGSFFNQNGDPNSGYTYDRHVPLIWYGWNVKVGYTRDKISVTDIAGTVSSLLGISFPSGSQANVISIPLNE